MNTNSFSKNKWNQTFASQPLVKRRNTSNTGSAFENLLIYSNNIYSIKKLAFIQKIEQPVKIDKKYQIGKVSGTLKESTVDYLGSLNNGRMVAFDAKSTSSNTSFPLKNIKDHQYEILKQYYEMKAISFLLVEWLNYNEVYILPFNILEQYWENAKSGKRGTKSIPYKDFASLNKVQRGNRGIPLDYLAPFHRY